MASAMCSNAFEGFVKFARMLSIQFAFGPNAGAACTDEPSADVASWRQHSAARLAQEAAPDTPSFGAWGVGADGRLSSRPRLPGGLNTQQRPDSFKRYQQEANPNAAACWHHHAASTPSRALASCTGAPHFDEGGLEAPHSGRSTSLRASTRLRAMLKACSQLILS